MGHNVTERWINDSPKALWRCRQDSGSYQLAGNRNFLIKIQPQQRKSNCQQNSIFMNIIYFSSRKTLSTISPQIKATLKNSPTPKIPFVMREAHLLAACCAYVQVFCSTTTNQHTQNGWAQVKPYVVIYVTWKALCVSNKIITI